MVCYILLGLVQSGLLPIILPLAAPPGALAGFTYAAFAGAGIAAPFIGAWSDRRAMHRRVLAGGMVLAVVALCLHMLPGGLVQHMLTAGLAGLGVSSASKVSTMFVVEVEPQSSWDSRISTLQACISGGQLTGLLAAGLLGLSHVGITFALAAGLLALAVPLALILAPDPVTTVDRRTLPMRAPRGGDAAIHGAQRTKHRLTWRALTTLGHSGTAWFLAAWLLSYTATNGLAVMFAVEMTRGFHVPAVEPTTAYAIGVALSLAVYRPVARWDARFGAWNVLAAGFGMRAVVMTVMLGVLLIDRSGSAIPVMVAFALMQVIWPVLSVASNTLAVTLSPAHRAESVGLLNATSSVGATIGGMIGGALLREGFAVLCGAVLVALMGAMLLAWHPRVRLDPAS